LLQACLPGNEEVCQAARWREIDSGVASTGCSRRGGAMGRDESAGDEGGEEWREYESEENERTNERTNECR